MELFDKIIIFFQAVGLLPLNLFKANSSNRINSCIVVFYLLIILAILSLCVRFYPDIFYSTDVLGGASDLVQSMGPISTHISILIVNYRHRKRFVTIFKRLNVIDKIFNEINPNLNMKIINAKMYFNYIVVTLIAQFITCSVEIRIMYGIRRNLQWSHHWYVTILSFFVTRSFYFFNLFFIEIIRGRVEVLNAELVHMKIRIEDLKKLTRIHLMLWKITYDTTNIFGWTQLLNIMVHFFNLVCDYYWNIVSLTFGNIFTTESLLCSIPPSVALFIFFMRCELFVSTVSEIGSSLHKFQYNHQNAIISRDMRKLWKFNNLIQRFSYQILLLQLELDVNGFFKMNLDLFKGVFVSIATYMMIFIQFMPQTNVFPNKTDFGL